VKVHVDREIIIIIIITLIVIIDAVRGKRVAVGGDADADRSILKRRATRTW
jgi:hypothetical protein